MAKPGVRAALGNKGEDSTGGAVLSATQTRAAVPDRAKLSQALDPECKGIADSPKLTQMVYGKLLRAIIEGRLDLGEPLSENDLARAFHLSKAPIRESLSELRVRGLVEIVPRSGSYVFSPNAQQIKELCDYRALLETNALRISMSCKPKLLVAGLRRIVLQMKEANRDEDIIAGNELDKEFHTSIIRLSENRYLSESYEHIGFTVEALRYRVMSTSLYRSKVQEEHARVTELLAGNQVSRAARLLESHIQRVKRVQSKAEWGHGRLKRKDYHFRDYAEILL